MIPESQIQSTTATIQDLKTRYFGTHKPELKSHWLRRSEKRKKMYCDPFGISDRALSSFTREYYETLQELPVHVIGVVVDKPGLKKKYQVRHFYPSSVCYEFLLQRVANYSHQYGVSEVSINFDDMSGKTPKGNEWKRLLIEQHQTLKSGKSPFYRTWVQRDGMNYNVISNRLDFYDSANSDMIQMADICAYNVFRQARDNWNRFDKEPYYYGYEQILPIMHRNPHTNRIGGSGAVCYP